jgi:WD40 repeat protein
VAALLTAIVIVTAVGGSIATWQWRRAVSKDIAERNARRKAEDEGRRAAAAKREVDRLSAGIALDQGSTLCQTGEVGRGLLWLTRALELAIETRDGDLEQAVRRNLGAWQSYLVRPRAAFGHKDWVWTIALSPDGRTALTGGKDRIARHWDTATGRQLAELVHDYPVWSVAFSPDGRRILTGSGDDNRHIGEVRTWDAATAKPLLPTLPHPEEVTDVSFSPNGQSLLTVCGTEARLWQAADGKLTGILLRHPRPARADRYAVPKMSATFSPDGRLIATGADDGTARLWDAATGEPRSDPLVCPGAVLAISFSPDGRTLATGSLNGGARLWDVSTGRQQGPALNCGGRVMAIAFTRDGAIVAAAGLVEDVDGQTGERRRRGGEARLWSTATGKPFGSALSHPTAVWALSFSPDGRMLLTGCEDSQARLFVVATGSQIGLPLAHEGLVRAVTFSPDGSKFLTGSAGGDGYAAARLWDIASGASFQQWALQSDGEISSLALESDGQKALIGSDDRKARILDLRSRRTIEPVMSHDAKVNVVAISHDGQLYLTGDDRGLVRLWDRADRLRPRHELRVAGWISSAAFSPNDRTALIGVGYLSGAPGSRSDVLVWDTRSGKAVGDPLPHTSSAFAAGFSPDGRTFVTGDEPGATLWDATTLQPLGERLGGWRSVPRAFFPDGKRFLLLNQGTAKIWDISSDRFSSPPPFHPEGRILNVALSKDGRIALTSGPERVARLWDVATGKALGAPVTLDGAREVAISADGQALAVSGSGGRIVVWTAPQPLSGDVERIRPWVELLAGMELDSRGVVNALGPGALRNRRQELDEQGGPPPFH